jgi:hypothetical protein
MKRLFAILVLCFLALGSAGLSATSAGAGPANCAPDTALILGEGEDLATPAALAERSATNARSTLLQGEQLACNSACARSCAQRFGQCPTRQCRQQFNACVRACGC